jgi:hypothetical protein
MAAIIGKNMDCGQQGALTRVCSKKRLLKITQGKLISQMQNRRQLKLWERTNLAPARGL